MKKKQKTGWALFQFPETQVDKNIPFSFNLYRLKSDGIVFLTTSLIIPFIVLFILRFAGGMGTDHYSIDPSWLALINLLIGIICFIVAIAYFYQKDSRLFIRSGLFIFYAFQLLPQLVLLLFSAFLQDNELSYLISMWIQTLSEVLIVAFAVWWVTDFKDRIILTFKRAWKQLLLVVILGALALIVVSIIYNLAVKDTALGGESTNQNTLTVLLTSDSLVYKIIGAFSLFIFTVLVAPITEELAIRQAWYVGVGNRTVAWITSALFFGMMHVSNGDVEHILDYFLAGLILSTIFSSAKGNITYNWLAHALSNFVSLVVTLAQTW